MAKTAKQGAKALQEAAASKLRDSEDLSAKAAEEPDESKKLDILLRARAEALAAKEFSRAAKALAKGGDP